MTPERQLVKLADHPDHQHGQLYPDPAAGRAYCNDCFGWFYPEQTGLTAGQVSP